MNEKTIVLAIVAILAVAAVGVGIYYVYGNDEDPATMSFLIEDGINEPFWIKGEGDDGLTAFSDACDKKGVDLKTSEHEWGTAIDSISNLEENFPVAWWVLYIHVDGAWEESMFGISQLKSSEVEYVAWVYTGDGKLPSIEP